MAKQELYLAYGSNLNGWQMRQRCPTARIFGTGTIPDYQLIFKGSRTGAYLTIEPRKGGSVPVCAWLLTREDEAALDRYEGCPRLYYKAEMDVPIKGIKTGHIYRRLAFLYIMGGDRPVGIPDETYVRTCAEGYAHFGFDPEVLKRAIARSKRRMKR